MPTPHFVQLLHTSSLLVLAAGRSTRMGSPKALLPIQGRSLLHRFVDQADALDLPLVVVLGHNAPALEAELKTTRAVLALNADYDRGQFSSLKEGLEAVKKLGSAPETTVCFMTPVDCPPVQPEVFHSLLEAYEKHRPLAVVPTAKGQPGHPVLLSPALIDQLCLLPPDSSLRDIFDRESDKILRLEVGREEILYNLNSPADYDAFCAALPRGESCPQD